MNELLNDIEETFGNAGHPGEGQAMKAYLKDKFECLGIKSPQRNELQKKFYNQIKGLSQKDKLVLCKSLWNLNGREFQYFAIEILKRYFKKPEKSLLKELRYFITTKSWWDTVDSLASNPLGTLLKTHPELTSNMDQWINDEDLWIRRSAIIFQLKYREQTDQDRLFHYCSLRMHEKDFFMRKAIGWALRQYGKFNPEAVIDFVKTNENSLSELSKKEALRNIIK